MNPNSETTSWSYQNNDWLSVQTDNNGNCTHYIHNALGQLTGIANYNPSASIVSEIYSITHDAAGNNLSESISIPGYTSLGGTITNTYDSLDQIATSHSTRSATGMGYSWTPAADGFEADAAGNLTTLRDQTQTYTASNNEINKSGFVYDDNGNPTTYEGTHTLTWDPENRLTEYTGSTTLTCGWRPDGMRAWKNSSSTTTYFYYDLLGVPVLEYRSGSIYAINTFGPNGLISRGTSSTNEIYYQFDERGNTITRSNSAATVLGYHGSDTYGVQFASETSTDPFLGFGAQWGYYRDSEISFLLLGHRIYDPGYARFLNRDPIGYAGGINLYSYGSNSPTGFIDPSGLDGEDEAWYDRLGDWAADKVQVAKNFYDQGLSRVPGGWVAAGFIDSGMDLVGGIARMPAQIGHLGSGLGAYAGCPSEENAIKAWGDVGSICSLALAGVGGDLYMNRPYWRYVSDASKPTFDAAGIVNDGTWLTRGRGFSAPYGTDWAGAKDALQLPYLPDSVIPVRVPWDKFTGWGRSVGSPDNAAFGAGGGAEFRVGGYGG